MILTGEEIRKRIKSGDIVIDPYDDKKINPNSYNLSLHKELGVYTEPNYLDMKKHNHITNITIPDSGLVLEPGKLYLGRTNEYTKTYGLVPMLEGRSSVGRLGICIHVSAGFGDLNFEGNWTLEISCIIPVKIYPNVDICQIYYCTVCGDTTIQYNGKYQKNNGIQESLMYKDFEQ